MGMIPKDKAKELVGKFYVNIPLRDCDNRRPHKLALIAVDEMIEESIGYLSIDRNKYWKKVKQEIEKL